MRWENLETEAKRRPRIPGVGEPVIRTFDAPEALGIRFHEVEARSAINKVPERSRMPFRYTINPYRGCAHACTYCQAGETPILMADGRAKPLRQLRAGDRVYGTMRDGWYRCYAITEVLDHWASVKPAFRVILEDGTELVASGDHRFLSDRGWKHVTGSRGRGGRPHLTVRNRLMGFGCMPTRPEGWLDYDYRRGYMCGLIRGDGHVSSSIYERPGRRPERKHVFRLALTDLEPVRRAREFLQIGGIQVNEYAYAEPRSNCKASTILQTGARRSVEEVRALIAWPGRATESWCKGFLAGFFDAEGSRSGGIVRIANTDPALIEWTGWCFRRLGFRYIVEPTGRPNGMTFIRLLGGLKEQMRFLLMVDPATTRKRSIEGVAIKSNARLRVASIERLEKPQRLYDITTGTGDFIANGVVSHNCFARPTHTYLDLNAREDFEREIVVKANVPEVVRAELGRRSWGGDHVALGTNTDPYQWVEGRYRLTRGIWKAMRDFSNPCSVLTKSSLLLRDLDLFRELVERTEFVANLSVPTIDEKAWRATEPHTPHPRTRLEAVAELVRNGIPAGVLIAPLMPGINDAPEQVEEILTLAGEAGARSVGGVGLHLRGEVREIWFDWLRQYRPDLLDCYERLYSRGAYLPKAESKRLSGMVQKGRKGSAMTMRGRNIDGARRRHARAPGESPGKPSQASLF